MIHDIHISGQATDRYEFHTTVVGPRLNLRLLYDGSSLKGQGYDRFCGTGSELRIAEDGVSHSGNGGTLCAYMYGVDVPEKDLLRRDVRNRLVMHGARYEERERRLLFTGETAGFEDFGRIFGEGHAYANFYFFVLADIEGTLGRVQSTILREAGRHLKRADFRRGGRDGRDTARALHDAIGLAEWTLFLIKLIDVNAEEYYRRFKSLYTASHEVGADDRRALDQVAEVSGIDPHQQTRIELQVMYEHVDNKKIIDQYKETIAAGFGWEAPRYALAGRFNLLRAFWTCNGVPAAIFDRLDALAEQLDAPSRMADPPFFVEARELVERLFAASQDTGVDPHDLVKLLHARRRARDHGREGFAAIVDDAARPREGPGEAATRELHQRREKIVTYLDLFDASAVVVDAVARRDDFELTEEHLETLLGSRQLFDDLRPSLFEELLLAPREVDQYLGAYGRQRVAALKRGLRPVVGQLQVAARLIDAIRSINEQAQMHRIIDRMLRSAVGNLHERPLTDGEKRGFRADIENRLRDGFGITTPVSNDLFDTVLHFIEEEYYYATELLPAIIATRDLALRDSFVASSGLDLARMEQLEAAYLRGTLAAELTRVASP